MLQKDRGLQLKLDDLSYGSTCLFFGPIYSAFVKDSFNNVNRSILKLIETLFIQQKIKELQKWNVWFVICLYKNMSNKNTKNNYKTLDHEYYYKSATQKVDQLRYFDNDSRTTFAKKNYSNQMLSKNDKIQNNLRQSAIYPKKQQYKIVVKKVTSKQEQNSRINTEGYENMPSGVRHCRNYQKNSSQDESEESVQSNKRQKSKLISIKKPNYTNKIAPITPNQARTQKIHIAKTKESPKSNKFLFYKEKDVKSPLQNSNIKQKQVYPHQKNRNEQYEHHNQFMDNQEQQPQYVYQKHVHQKGQDKKVRLKNKLGFIVQRANMDEDASVSYYFQSNSQINQSEHQDNKGVNKYRTEEKAKKFEISQPIRNVQDHPKKKGKQIQERQLKLKIKQEQQRQKIEQRQRSQRRQKIKHKQRIDNEQTHVITHQNQKAKYQQQKRIKKRQDPKSNEDKSNDQIPDKTTKKSRPSIKQKKEQFKKYIESRRKSQQRHQQSSSSIKQIISLRKIAQNNQKQKTQQRYKQRQKKKPEKKQSDIQQKTNNYPQYRKNYERAAQQQQKTTKFQIKLQKVQIQKLKIFNPKKLKAKAYNNLSKKFDFQNEDTQTSKNSARTHNRYKTQTQHAQPTAQSEDYLQHQLLELIEKNEEYLGKARAQIKHSSYQGIKDKIFLKDDHVDLKRFNNQTPRRRLKTQLNQRQQEDDRTLTQRQKTFLKLLKSKEQDLMRKLRQEANNPKHFFGDSYELKTQSPSRKEKREAPSQDERESDTNRINPITKTYQISKMLPVLSTATRPKRQIDSQQAPYRYYNMKHERQFQHVANPIRQKNAYSMGNNQFSIKYMCKQLVNEVYPQKSQDLNDKQYRTQNINEKYKRLKRLVDQI